MPSYVWNFIRTPVRLWGEFFLSPQFCLLCPNAKKSNSLTNIRLKSVNSRECFKRKQRAVTEPNFSARTSHTTCWNTVSYNSDNTLSLGSVGTIDCIANIIRSYPEAKNVSFDGRIKLFRIILIYRFNYRLQTI
jgi:hypothetical protein